MLSALAAPPSATVKNKIASGPDKGRAVIRTHKAAANSLLGLLVLVQNRRKDKERILVFGSQIQVVSYPSLNSAVLHGTAQGDNIAKFTRDRYALSVFLSLVPLKVNARRRVSYVAAGVASDPWDKVPRLEIRYFNGQEVSEHYCTSDSAM